MERALSSARASEPLSAALLAAAARAAAEAAREQREPARAIDAAAGVLHEAAPGVLPAVFVLQHGRLWLVAQRGYAVVPDGIGLDRGVMGRAVRRGRPQRVADVGSDPDYVGALPSVVSELAVPLLAERGSPRSAVGVLNVESGRELPGEAARLVRPLTVALTPLVSALAESQLDLAGLARLFVHLSSLREPEEIASLAAAALPKVLPVEASHVLLWGERGEAREAACWRAREGSRPLSLTDLERARSRVDPGVVCQVLAGAPRGPARPPQPTLAWLPLRAGGQELGALVGVCRPDRPVETTGLDTAAVFSAHVAASLDAALSLRRERESALTDSLTGILNRRGLEECLERELAAAHERRLPVSVLVLDCDDFKEVNDRAGHDFGDALLEEVAATLERTLPEGALAARLGGDEFVVVLPGADADAASEHGARLRRELAAGLTDAGFPLRMSAGIATYPFDGADGTALVRAADQALYAAKEAGKDRVASFRDLALTRAHPAPPALPSPATERRAGRRSDGTLLAETLAAVRAIESEPDPDAVCERLCKALVFLVGATGCSVSRVAGEHLVETAGHALRDISLGGDAVYVISDFPLTEEVLASGEARALSFLDDEIDRAEAFLLRELGMQALLMVPLVVRGQPWGLVELYEMRLRRFSASDVALAELLCRAAARRLETLPPAEEVRGPRRVYRLPRDAEAAPPGAPTR